MVLNSTPGIGLTVVLSTGQVPAWPVKILHSSSSDGVSVSHKSMPRPGSWGMCAFPGGDNRSGVWLGSLYLSGQDAFTSDTDPNLNLDSHFSGAYELLDGAGNWTKSFPDGTYIQSAATTAKPVLNRHVIGADQSRSLVAFPDSARIPSPPSARPFIIQHASGASIQIDPTGDITLTSATSSPCIIAVSATGAITVTAPSSVTLNAPGVTTSGNLSAGNGVSGIFAANGGVNVTVRDGIVTNIY